MATSKEDVRVAYDAWRSASAALAAAMAGARIAVPLVGHETGGFYFIFVPAADPAGQKVKEFLDAQKKGK
jgi:hypothetical protein